MSLEMELLSYSASEAIRCAIREVYVNEEKEIQSLALLVLTEIQEVVKDEKVEDDFFVVEKIVCIFEKYDLDAGARHDFG